MMKRWCLCGSVPLPDEVPELVKRILDLPQNFVLGCASEEMKKVVQKSFRLSTLEEETAFEIYFSWPLMMCQQLCNALQKYSTNKMIFIL